MKSRRISKPYVVRDLYPPQIDARVASERESGFNPIPFENRYLRGYHWWLYPNYDEGIYSKVYAHVNVVGDLVVGRGEQTRLVCIIDGKLVLRQRMSDSVVSASDARLLVCL